MIFDAATGLIMFFGGTGPNGYLGDTWSWNGTTRTWTENHPRQSPSPRRTMLAYDYSAAILFGGDQGSLYYGDTWTWDGTNWRLRSPDVAPSSRTMGAMVWDDALKRVVLFGGSGGPNSTDALNDTWFWQDGAWTPADVIGELPPARWAAGSDYDAASQKLVLFGGFTTYPLGDTWLLSPASGAPQN